MDGVIVDSEPLHEQAFRDLFDELGYGARHGIHFPDYFGRSDTALCHDFVQRHGCALAVPELVRRKQERFMELLRLRRPIFSALPPIVHKLAQTYRLALASGSPHHVVSEVLDMANLRPYFPVVVSVQDVGKGKPAPDVFLRAAELLGFEPRRCCVIEDAAVGVEGALTAGMNVIAITNSLPAEKLARATWIARSYDEIARILLPSDS